MSLLGDSSVDDAPFLRIVRSGASRPSGGHVRLNQYPSRTWAIPRISIVVPLTVLTGSVSEARPRSAVVPLDAVLASTDFSGPVGTIRF